MKAEEKAEKAVLGACFLNNQVIPQVITKLSVDDFFYPQHQQVYDLIQKRFAKGETVDTVVLAGDMLTHGGGDPMILQRMVEASPVVANVDQYIDIVADAATRRRLSAMSVRAQQLAETGAEPDKIIEEIQTGLEQAVNVDESETVRLGETLETVLDDVAAREDGKQPRGIMTGFTELDEITNGLSGGQMIIVAARPGVGKSTLAVDFMRHASIKNGIPSLIFSLEMGRGELVERIISAETNVRTHDLKTGSMSEDDWANVTSAIARLDDAPLYIADSAEVTMMDIAARSRLMVAQHGVKMIVVDYLQLLTSGRRAESRQQEVSDFSRQLKLLAKSLDVPIVAIAQLNRGVEMRGEDALPKASDLRESGSLEQDADIVLLIHRPDVSNRDHERAGEADLIIGKHRGGSVGTVTVAHQLHYSKFSNPQF